MTGEESSTRTFQCIYCDGQTEGYGSQIQCMDCGGRMERAPDDTLVRSRTLWWVEKLGYGVVIAGFVVEAAVMYANRSDLLFVLPAALAVLAAAIDGTDFIEAIRHV
jgi:hypothetical protein